MSGAAAVLARYLSAGGAVPMTVAALAMASAADDEVLAAVAAAVPDGPEEAGRLEALRAAIRRHPAAMGLIREVLALVPHGPAGDDPEAHARRVAEGFDAAARRSPEAAVALHSLGEADVLAPATAQIVNQLESVGAIVAGARILDVGCGAGRLALALAPRVGHVTGIDPSAEMIAVARRRAGSRPTLRFEVGFGHEMTVAEAAFDAAVALDSMPYVVAAGGTLPERTFGAVAAALKPGGLWVVMNLSYRGDAETDRSDATRWAAAAGLRLDAVVTDGFDLWDGVVFVFRKPL